MSPAFKQTNRVQQIPVKATVGLATTEVVFYFLCFGFPVIRFSNGLLAVFVFLPLVIPSEGESVDHLKVLAIALYRIFVVRARKKSAISFVLPDHSPL